MSTEARQRLLGLLPALLGDSVVRRAMRRKPAEQLSGWGLVVPEPPGPLVTNIMGRSAWLEADDLLGRWPDESDETWARDWVRGTDVDVGLLLCLLGARPMTLLMLPELRAEAVAWHLRGSGWSCLLGPSAFSPAADEGRGGFADAAAQSWAARAGSGGWRSLLVAPSSDLVVAGWLALHFDWHTWLGILLGYPPCCADSFTIRWSAALEQHGGDMSRDLLAPPGEATYAHWTANAFTRVLGAGVPLHFPCRNDCPETAAKTTWHLNALALAAPQRADQTVRLLQSAVVIGADGETIALPDWNRTSQDSLEYLPETIVATTVDTELAQALQGGEQTGADELATLGARLVLSESSTSKEAPHEVSQLTAARSL